MLKKTLCATAFALAMAAPHVTAGPARFVDLSAPAFTSSLGERLLVNRFSLDDARGIKLRNAGNLPVNVQDTVSLATFTLAPGAQLGLSCEAVRHLALSVDGSVVYETVPCGSLVRITASKGDVQ